MLLSIVVVLALAVLNHASSSKHQLAKTYASPSTSHNSVILKRDHPHHHHHHTMEPETPCRKLFETVTLLTTYLEECSTLLECFQVAYSLELHNKKWYVCTNQKGADLSFFYNGDIVRYPGDGIPGINP